MKKISIKAQPRSLTGRKVKKLRKEGVLPANIYGNKVKSQSISVDYKEFIDVLKEVGETGIVELHLGKGKKHTLIHNVQRDPVSDLPIHADFLQVDLKKKVTAQIPVEIVGVSPAEKLGGTLAQYLNEIEVEALPSDLPEKFEIDATVLKEIDQVFSVGDLKVDKVKVDIRNEKDQLIVKVEPPRAEEEPEVEVTEEETPEGEEDEKEKDEKGATSEQETTEADKEKEKSAKSDKKE